MCFTNSLKQCKEEGDEKGEETWAISGSVYLTHQTTNPISFKFDM